MFTKLIDVLFGCSHANYSFPRSVRSRRSAAAAVTGTYVVCLDCGREIPYDWQHMRVITSLLEASGAVPTLATKQAA